MFPDDDFDQTFDDDFVGAARFREPSHAERRDAARLVEAQRRRLRSLRRRAARRRALRRFARWTIVFVGFAVVAAAVVVGRLDSTSVRDVSFGADGLVITVDGAVDLPSASPDEEEHRLMAAREPSTDSDSYEFLQVDPEKDEPIRFNPCRPIHVVVAGAERLPGGRDLVDRAVGRVSEATGLSFTVEGDTTERPSTDRDAVQERYGDRWAPVLVAFTDEDQVPELVGDIAGVGGGSMIRRGDRTAFVSGLVYVDVETFDGISDPSVVEEGALAVLLHEFGHLVGLDHVDDPEQIMYPTSGEVLDYGAGDVAGFARAGAGDCIPGL